MQCTKCKKDVNELVLNAVSFDKEGEITVSWIKEKQPICGTCETEIRNRVKINPDDKVYLTTAKQMELWDQ